MALSLALHGLALVPLLLAGMAGSSASHEPALMVELSLAAPTPGPASEAEARVSSEPRQPPEPETPAVSVEHAAALLPPPEPQPEVALEPEIRVELPPPQEVPPVQAAELKPADPPKPKPAAAKPPAPRPNTASAWTHAPVPDAGNASTTQQASAASMVVFEGKPRYRLPPAPPVYPPRAIELNQQGEALVRVRLDPDGSAAEILLWRGSGFALLDRAALAAVRGWHFLPAMRDGRPVAAWVEIPVRFHLR